VRVVNIKAFARKEFYHLIRDFRSLYLSFVTPLVLILLFGYALNLDVDNIKTVLVDYDKTYLTRDFTQKLGASSYFNIIGSLSNTKEVTEFIDKGLATMAVIIPPDWTNNLNAERKAPVQVLIDGSDPNFASLSRGYVTSFINNYNKERLLTYLNKKGEKRIKTPVEGLIRVWFNEDLESKNFIIPGIIALIVMISGAMMTSLVIAREYESGTMETIMSLPVTASEFLYGKSIPYFFIGMTDVLIAVFMGQALFGVIIKSSFWLLLLSSSVYLLVALSLGLLISITTKSQLVANIAAILVTYLPSLLLSDFVFPIAHMPKVLQAITYLVPARYFIDILNGLYLRGLGFNGLWFNYLILTLMVLLLTSLNLFTLKREGL
jgi:ABC-2 type transport system permease protein